MAGNQILTRKKAVIVVPETVYGEPGDINEGSLMLVTDLSSTPYQGDTVERTRLRATLGGNAQINTGPNVQVTVTCPWSGSGDAATPPAQGVLLRACGMAETVVEADAENSVAAEVNYKPVSGNMESVTLYFFQDGEQQVVPGVRGTLSLNPESGSLPAIEYTLTGLYQRPTEASQPNLSVQNQVDEVPVNFQNTSTFSIFDYSAIGQSLSLDLGNTVSYRNLVNYEGVDITERASTGQFNVRAPRLSDHDFFSAVESHQGITTGKILFEHGTTAGNIVGLRTVNSQLTSISREDSDGVVHYQMDAQHLPKDGDDEVTLYFR